MILKYKHLSLSLVLIISLWLIPFLQCSHPTEVAGAGVETTNGQVRGLLVEAHGLPIANSIVQLFPSSYNPLTDTLKIHVDTTDASGYFSFANIKTGTYTVFSKNVVLGLKAAKYNVKITSSDTTKLQPVTMLPSGSLKLKIPEYCDTVNGYFYIPGTNLIVSLKNATNGSVIIDSVPVGEIPGVLYSVQSKSSDPQTMISSITVKSNSLVTVVYTSWLFTRSIVINTTSSGVFISSNITNFPLLIRLSSKNFDFSQAKADGSDLRISKSNGTPIPCEIEQWDAVNNRAAIWVKVDTIYASNDSQSITLYWGNSEASRSSSDSGVFDTTDNIISAWHLNNYCKDATGNRHDATVVSTIDTPGIIGRCQTFNGSDSIKIPGLLGSPSSISISAWAQLDSTDSIGGGEIISIGDAAMIRMDYTRDSSGTSGISHISSGTKFNEICSGNFLKNTGWHFLAFTFDHKLFRYTLYIDGIKAGTRTEANLTINYSGVGGNTIIGKHGNGKTGYGFYGRIDEVRVYREAMPADYIKLCYMNQKENDCLLTFK
jgi:hypothetical protein